MLLVRPIPFIKDIWSEYIENAKIQADTYEKIAKKGLEGEELPPPELKGTINISSIPTGAKIYVDMVYVWETTNTSFLVNPGHHTITLKKDGYEDKSQEIDIAAGETKYISMTLISIAPPAEPPPAEPPAVPSEEVVIPLIPKTVVYNAWKVTIKAVDASTNEPLSAGILINDEWMDSFTPWWFYFAPESTYNIKLRKAGYKQGEVDYTTPALPEA